jgi:hypothetical protein
MLCICEYPLKILFRTLSLCQLWLKASNDEMTYNGTHKGGLLVVTAVKLVCNVEATECGMEVVGLIEAFVIRVDVKRDELMVVIIEEVEVLVVERVVGLIC